METVSDLIEYFKKLGIRVKITLSPELIMVRVPPKYPIGSLADYLNTVKDHDLFFHVYGDLKWYECRFKKIQVDDSAIVAVLPHFDAFRKFAE